MFDKILDRLILIVVAGMLLFITWTDRTAFLRVLEIHEKTLAASQANAEARACEVMYLEKELKQFYVKKGAIKQ